MYWTTTVTLERVDRHTWRIIRVRTINSVTTRRFLRVHEQLRDFNKRRRERDDGQFCREKRPRFKFVIVAKEIVINPTVFETILQRNAIYEPNKKKRGVRRLR